VSSTETTLNKGYRSGLNGNSENRDCTVFIYCLPVSYRAYLNFHTIFAVHAFLSLTCFPSPFSYVFTFPSTCMIPLSFPLTIPISRMHVAVQQHMKCHKPSGQQISSTAFSHCITYSLPLPYLALFIIRIIFFISSPSCPYVNICTFSSFFFLLCFSISSLNSFISTLPFRHSSFLIITIVSPCLLPLTHSFLPLHVLAGRNVLPRNV